MPSDILYIIRLLDDWIFLWKSDLEAIEQRFNTEQLVLFEWNIVFRQIMYSSSPRKFYLTNFFG